MSDATKQTGDRFEIPPVLSEDFVAYEIVYARFTFDPLHPKPCSTVRADPTSYVICPDDVLGQEVTTLDEEQVRRFAHELANGRPLPKHRYTRVRHRCDPWEGAASPLDIYVGCPSYVLIELDPKLEWRFRRGHPGITAKEDYKTSNQGLRHLEGERAHAGSASIDGTCRFIWFRVLHRDPYQHQQFNYHLERKLADGRWQAWDIDPDIPNDGGEFPAVPRTPCMGSQPSGDAECEGPDKP